MVITYQAGSQNRFCQHISAWEVRISLYAGRMPSVKSNGLSFEYDIRGEGEPLLLIMGLTGQLIDWPDDFVDLFVEAGYQVIRFDNRDIGLSSQIDEKPPSRIKFVWSVLRRRQFKHSSYDLQDMAADSVGLLDSLGIDSAHVMGISMGGMIAQELAIGYPHRVRSLCSIMSNTGDRRTGLISIKLIFKLAVMKPPSRRKAARYIVKVFELISGPHFDEKKVEEMADSAVARSFTPKGVERQSAAVAASRDRTELLGSVVAPTLVIHGIVDPLVLFSGGVTTAKAVPGSRLLAFGDMGHDLPRPRWQEMRDAIDANCRRGGVLHSLEASLS